jgi:dTDP-4-amino-4,6-dideoxygalactose transaminase
LNITYGHPNIKCNHDLLKDIEEILNSGWISIGKYMESLEKHFREKFHVKHAIACSCATTGLIIAIKAAGWKNDRVALPAFTWPSTLYAIECNGNEPLFMDMDRETWLSEPYMDEPCKKMVAVDTFGSEWTVDMPYKTDRVIIDAAHSYGNPNLGKRGLAEVVSLSFTKNVTATEGGMILTDDDKLAETATELRRLSGRMEEINALIALESISQYDDNTDFKRINHYEKHICTPHKKQLCKGFSSLSVYSILFEDRITRDAVRVALAKAGCETKVYYDPLREGLPNTEYVYDRILSLPIHDGVKDVQDQIIEIINTAGRNARTPGKDYLTK